MIQVQETKQLAPEEFIKWLNELLQFNSDIKELDENQTKILKDKLNLVFNKVTPIKDKVNKIKQQTKSAKTDNNTYFNASKADLISLGGKKCNFTPMVNVTC